MDTQRFKQWLDALNQHPYGSVEWHRAFANKPHTPAEIVKPAQRKVRLALTDDSYPFANEEIHMQALEDAGMQFHGRRYADTVEPRFQGGV